MAFMAQKDINSSLLVFRSILKTDYLAKCVIPLAAKM